MRHRRRECAVLGVGVARADRGREDDRVQASERVGSHVSLMFACHERVDQHPATAVLDLPARRMREQVLELVAGDRRRDGCR